MKESGVDERLPAGAKKLFDDSVERLDAATLSRLNQGRQQALAELQHEGRHVRWGRWLPATGIAAAAIVTVMVMRGPTGVDVTADAMTASDFEMLLDADGFEMIEDLEFYSLLDAVDTAADDDIG